MADDGNPPADSQDKDRDAGQQPHHEEDGLVENYRTILNELGLLTTVSVLLFGFLLSSAGGFNDSVFEEAVYSVAIVLVATATLIFILPVAYHHMQYPYHDFDKFTERAHGWTVVGIPMLGGSMYLSLSLAIWSLLREWALLIAMVPIAATIIVFLIRRKISSDF